MLDSDQSALEQAAMPYRRVADKIGWVANDDGVVILSSLKSKDGKLPTIYIGRGYPLRTKRIIPDSREATFEICTPDIVETIKRSVTALKMEAEVMRKGLTNEQIIEPPNQAGPSGSVYGSQGGAPGAEGNQSERTGGPLPDGDPIQLPQLDI